MVPRKLTGIVRAQCSIAGTARGEDAKDAAAFDALDAEVAAAGLCKESSWMAAKACDRQLQSWSKSRKWQLTCQL